TLVVQVPTKLNEEQKEALRQFDASLNGDSKPNKTDNDSKDTKESKFKKFFGGKN
ncbi:MAG: molecular chaperone DnaJ, partial [Clostridiales bacterium]|nr:molecular chaperone DnaJ [Clostridiales bacterium]